jgi:hypothetical protein
MILPPLVFPALTDDEGRKFWRFFFFFETGKSLFSTRVTRWSIFLPIGQFLKAHCDFLKR